MRFDLLHKAAFDEQFAALPRDQQPLITQKLVGLTRDPTPDAKVRKRLVGAPVADLCRLRSGDYRVVYTYATTPSPVVVLIAVDTRDDVYRGDQLVWQTDIPLLPAAARLDADRLLAGPPPAPPAGGHSAGADARAELPARITRDLCECLRVPEEHVAALCACRTIDDLVAAPIPEAVRERIFDVVTSDDLERILAQPTLVTGDAGDLLRYAEGELLGFLLRLDPEQERVVPFALHGGGPTLVKGSPGTGKSIVALYRVRALVDDLLRSGMAEPRVLVTTYTRALIAVTEQLLGRLLGASSRFVTVQTADSVAYGIVAASDGRVDMLDDREQRRRLDRAVEATSFEGATLQVMAQRQAIDAIDRQYLLDEVRSIDGREISTLADYLGADRPGRRLPLNATQRTAVWSVHQAFSHDLEQTGAATWQRLRRRAHEVVTSGAGPQRYDAVVVDEAQDLDRAALRMLVGLCASTHRLFLAADADQSIYGASFRWRDVHRDLRVQGRTATLRVNHRSTRQIGDAARSFLAGGALDTDQAAPEYVFDGPLPAVRRVATPYDETELLRRFLRGAARELRLGLGACAVLVPSEEAARVVAGRLHASGCPAAALTGGAVDLERKQVAVMTLRAAKGLEFPVVAIAGFLDGRLLRAPRGSAAEAAEEVALKERRTLFVAMTRAMRALLVILDGRRDAPALDGFDATLWNTGVERDS